MDYLKMIVKEVGLVERVCTRRGVDRGRLQVILVPAVVAVAELDKVQMVVAALECTQVTTSIPKHADVATLSQVVVVVFVEPKYNH
jgi:hypothetical protein